MDFTLQEAVIKHGRRDPSPRLVVMATAMLLVVGLFVLLPPLLFQESVIEYNVQTNKDSSINGSVTGGLDVQYSDTVIDKTTKIHLGVVDNPTSKDSSLERKQSKEDSSLADKQPSTDLETVDEKTGEEDSFLVETRSGLVHGIESKGVRVFHGVPYAQPPVGSLRWQPPVQVTPWWPHVHDSTKPGAACPQSCSFHGMCPTHMSEDCLHLEIYTPLEARPTSALPVQVYLHGGGFNEMSASSAIYDPTYVVKRTGLVVVLVEYRLGALGFLVHTNPNNETVANLGILDQALALDWLSANLWAFGGHPDKVTLVGQSAGSQSVLIHLQSAKTSSRFRSVILESPPLSLPLKTVSQAFLQAEQFAQVAGCSDDGDRAGHEADRMTCLRSLDTHAILEAQSATKSFGSILVSKAEPWGPVLDGRTVSAQLSRSYKYIVRYEKPILWGVTEDEAFPFVLALFKQPTNLITYIFAKSLLSKRIDSDLFDELYPAKASDSREDISVAASDFLFRCPAQWTAEKLHHRGTDAIWSYVWHKALLFDESDFKYACSNRSCHGVEIPYTFHTFEAMGVHFTWTDSRISDHVIDYYSNFIKFGNPNGEKENASPTYHNLPFWPEAFSSGQFRALGFQKNGQIAVEDGVQEEKCRLWVDNDFQLG